MILFRLCPLIALPVAFGQKVSSANWRIRPATRSDILPIALLMGDSFAAQEPTFSSPKPQSSFDKWLTTGLLALDIERRCTTWAWSRHLQLVAESSGGGLVGFVEIWGEDEDSIGNRDAPTPQPCLFNLCVQQNARRLGIAQALIERCEATCLEWGERELFLKVRLDNEAAYLLYKAQGFHTYDTVEASETIPKWQARLAE